MAARRADLARPQRRGLTLAAVAVLAVTAAVGTVTSSLNREAATTVATRAATDLAAVCATDRGATDRAGADCALATEVARNGPPSVARAVAGDDGADGQDGTDGADGAEGRGIVSTRLDGGRLVVVYSDGETRDVGPVVGEDGTDGEDGADGTPGTDGADGLTGPGGTDGRGVASTTVDGGRLVVTYTDDTTADLGPVVGPAGRGIASLDGTSGRLLVTLTDGAVVDAGPLPPGPAGSPAPGLAGQTFRFPDGSQRVCERAGGDDTAPVMACGDRVGGEQPAEDPPAEPGTEAEEG